MESFRTTDIILAAVLRLHDVELIDIEIVGNKGTFVFTNVDDEFVSRKKAWKILWLKMINL